MIYRYNLEGQFEMGRRYKAGTIIRALHPLESFKNLLALGGTPVALYRFKEYVPNGGGVIDGGTVPGVVVTPPDEDDWNQGSDWLNPPTDDNDYPSDPGAGIPIGGGGGGGNGSTTISATFDESDLSEFEFIIDPGDVIENIEDYIECFNDGKPGVYKLTLYVDQPIAGKSDQYMVIPPDLNKVNAGIIVKTGRGAYGVGHVFVGFGKENTDGTSVRQIFGFYPAGSAGVSSVKSKIVDDSGHPYDVRYTIEVSKDQFFNAISQVQQDIQTNKEYMLHDLVNSEYNCGDAALNWIRAGGISIPDAPRGFFNNAPSDLGQALSQESGAIIQTGKAACGSGSCN